MEDVAEHAAGLSRLTHAPWRHRLKRRKPHRMPFEISKKQFRVGGVSYVTVLNTQRLFLGGAPEPRAGPGRPGIQTPRHYSRRWGAAVES